MPLRETKIAPAFFIGLGGCGGAIVDELARKVKQEESFERYRDLVHFFALDTDVDDLARLKHVDTAHKFVLSDFHKPEYVDFKRGKLHAKEDPAFCQWWPDWYRPRDTRGKGAGQIRIESRLALYHHLENDSAKILETFEKAIRRAYDVHNPFRANKAAKIYVYASLAGGTGSGGFATMAYTVRRLLGGQRGHLLIGTFVLPNVFKSKGLPPNQFDKVMANGYSALQELELLQTARPESKIEFHHDPDHPERAMVDRPAFDQVYLVEEKTSAGVVIADPSQVYPAIADAAHAQIFSPIVDKEGSTLDNDTRELMQLDEQTFTKSFGSFGISALVLPTRDILRYAAFRLGADVLASAVPGGRASDEGRDLESADAAFAADLELRAERGDPEFRRAVEWARGGASGGEGAVAAFLRRCKEDVLKRIDQAVKIRAWEESELSTFEKDPERVQSETASAFAALSAQVVKSEDAARGRAKLAAAEVAGDSGPLSLAEITRGRSPTEARYLYAVLRQALAGEQDALRKAYERGLHPGDGRLQEDFRAQVEALKEAAPETLLEKLPGRENDYHEVAASFCAWYRDCVQAMRGRVRANAMLEFSASVLSEIDRRRAAIFHFFSRIDRVMLALEREASRLLQVGGARAAGGDANAFMLDVEVLQDHRTGARFWEHVYRRVVRASDFHLSGAMARLAEVSAEGGSEQDVQRRVVEALARMSEEALRPRIAGSRGSPGLRLDEELAFEARVARAIRHFRDDGLSEPPPAGDPRWAEEMARVSDTEIRAYIEDKLEHAASKCRPFVTLSVGAPLLPPKAYVVLHPDYQAALGPYLAHLASHRVDAGQVVATEDRTRVVFYAAELGVPLHAVKSLVDYERRYFAVKEKELAEGAKIAHLPRNVPQIPIHQDKNWEGLPDAEARLFRISIEGVKAGDSKIAYAERMAQRRDARGAEASGTGDLRDFTLGVALGLVRFDPEGPAGEAHYLEDPDLPPEARRLGKFRDQAFDHYRARHELQKAWLRREAAGRLARFEEERDYAGAKALLDAHVASIERLMKVGAGGPPVLTHLQKELEAALAFRREKGL